MADGSAHAPSSNYGATSAQNQYGSPASDSLGQYGDNDVAASDQDNIQGGSGDPIENLKNNIPGVPGEDYPILAEVPELSFTCEGRVAGGKFFLLFLVVSEKKSRRFLSQQMVDFKTILS